MNGARRAGMSCQFGTMFTEPPRAALLADETPADTRPELILGQSIEPNVAPPSIAFTAETLDAACYVPLC